MKINFRQNLYAKESIQSAIKEFKDYEMRHVTSRGKYYQVEMMNTDQVEDLDVIVSEFKNYVLYLNIIHAANQ